MLDNLNNNVENSRAQGLDVNDDEVEIDLQYDVIKQNIDRILRLEKEPERGRETERLQ